MEKKKVTVKMDVIELIAFLEEYAIPKEILTPRESEVLLLETFDYYDDVMGFLKTTYIEIDKNDKWFWREGNLSLQNGETVSGEFGDGVKEGDKLIFHERIEYDLTAKEFRLIKYYAEAE